MNPTDAQTSKIVAALQPLFADPDFAGSTKFNVAITMTPPEPQPVVVNVEVDPALPA